MTPAVMRRRRLLLSRLGASLLTAGLAGPSWAQPLPQRNLRVEVRQGDEAELAARSVSATGSVVISSSGGRGSLAVQGSSREQRRRQSTAQQILVMNGGRASVRIGQSVPLRWVQVVWRPDGPVVTPTTLWLQPGQGFTVQPRWPGGQEWVAVELAAESSTASGMVPGAAQGVFGAQGAPAVQGQTTGTSVQVPLGEWVTVAASDDASAERRSGPLAREQQQSVRRMVVQLRITAP